MKHLLIKTTRDAYTVANINGMTVRELIDKLEQFDDNLVVAFTNDNYMYSGVNEVYYDWHEYDAFVEVEDKPDDEDDK